jgi:hypothetical protein
MPETEEVPNIGLYTFNPQMAIKYFYFILFDDHAFLFQFLKNHPRYGFFLLQRGDLRVPRPLNPQSITCTAIIPNATRWIVLFTFSTW